MKPNIKNKEAFTLHFPSGISQAISDYVSNTVLLKSRYIFTWRKNKQQYGYCTHCKNEYKTNGLKHKEKIICPRCNSSCEVRSSGLSRKFLHDKAYFVYYEKSLINPNAIVARGFYVSRDYSGDFRITETQFNLEAVYLFEPGKSHFFHRCYYFSNFEEKKSVFSLFDTAHKNIECFCSIESIQESVKDTSFQYSTWESYQTDDMVRFFDLSSKYPCIEYLTKLGLSEVVKAKLYGWKTYSAINWRGKTIYKVLRLSKQDIKEIRNTQLDPYTLRLFQIGKSDKSNLTIEEAKNISRCYTNSDYELQKVLKSSSLRKAHSYISKQYLKDKKHFYTQNQVLTHWKDYLQDCLTLGLDINSEYVVFPSNLYNAHQNTIKQVKIKADAELDKKIAKRVKSLEKYLFETNSFFIRPATCSQELIDEGKRLQHCVGTYAEKYAEGDTNLFVIRKINNPGVPFYTVEIVKNKIIQVRGLKNCLPTNEVQDFIDAFNLNKLTKKTKERKVAV